MGIHYDGIGLVDDRECPLGRLVEGIGNQPEIAAIGGVDVDAEAVLLLEAKHPSKRVDRADGGGPQGDDDRSHVALAQFGFEGVEATAGRGDRLATLS